MVRVATILIFLCACGGTKSSPPVAAMRDADPAADAAPADLAAALAPLATAGPACLVVRFPDGTTRASDDTVCAERLRPMSTFKIANALIGADVGLLDGPDAIMEYDAKEWAKDQPLRKAMEVSAVPAFRLLATKIGAERMKAHLDAFGYGNRAIGNELDRFWLTGTLAISAPEQVEFVARLVAGTLAASVRAHETVRAAMPVERRAGGVVLHHKTGTGSLDDRQRIGWLVGWVERPDGTYPYACWIKHPAGDIDAVRDYRMRVCKGALEAAGLL
jgi:beta-lactamase class D